MGRYLFQGSYSVDGIKGVLKEGGTGRRKAVEEAVKALGGKVEAYYFGFGETDVYVIVDRSGLFDGHRRDRRGARREDHGAAHAGRDRRRGEEGAFVSRARALVGYLGDRWLTFDCFGTLIDWRHGIRTTGELLFPGRGADFLDAYIGLEAEVENGPFRRY